MPVQPIIPPEWGWAYDIAVGQDWPQADEDALRRLAQAWTDAMEALLTVADGGNAAAQNVNYSVQSVSSDEFNNYWSQYVQGDNSVVGQMAQQCENLAAQLLAFAEQTEFTKLSIDIQLIILFIQLAIDIVMAFVTFGASTSEGVLAAFITRLTVRGFLTELIKAVIMAVLPDVITQTIMLAEGHRSSFDVGETLQAAQMGVIGGLVGGLVGQGLGKFGVSKFIDSAAGKVIGEDAGKILGQDAGKFVAGTANAALHGALTNVGTNIAAGTVDSVENQIHAAVDPVYAQELQQQTQNQGYADQKSGQNPLIAALNGAFTGALFHTVHEGSSALAGNAFGAMPLSLTDAQGNNPQHFTALPIRDGSGSNYALFDESHQLVGKGTVGDNGAITITPNNGSSYDGQVVTLGDQKFAPVGTPAEAGATPTTTPEVTQLASETPQEQQPSLLASDHPVSEQPVTSTDQSPADQTPSTTQAPPVQVPLVQVDQQPAVIPEQPAEVPPVQADQPAPTGQPATPVGSEVAPGTPVTGQPVTSAGPEAVPVTPQQAVESPATVPVSSLDTQPPTATVTPVSEQSALPYPGETPGATVLSSVPLQESAVAPPGSGDWFPLGAEHPEPGQQPQPEVQPTELTSVTSGTSLPPLTPRQVEDIAGTPTVPLSWDRPLVFTDTGEAMTYAERVWDAAISQLTPEQKAALMAYTGEAIVGSSDTPSYHSINRYLRGETPLTPEILDSIAKIDEALRLQPVPENLVVNRTTNRSVFVGTDGQPVEHPADLLGLLGSVHEAPSYLSTHFGAYHPGGEEVALHLAVPEGTPALYLGTISVDPSQHELLLGRGLSFQIDRVWVEQSGLGGDTWHVQAHILPEHPAIGQQPGHAAGHQEPVSPAELRASSHRTEGGVQVSGTTDPILSGHMQPITVENAFVVEAHGAAGTLYLDGKPIDLTASDLPAQLRALGWDGAKPIVLASCEAGLTGGAADQLAAALPGTDVIATDALVWRDRNGNVVAASEAVIDGRLQPTLVEENGHLTGDGVWQLHRAGAETVELTSEHPLNPTRPELISREAEFTDLAARGVQRGEHPPDLWEPLGQFPNEHAAADAEAFDMAQRWLAELPEAADGSTRAGAAAYVKIEGFKDALEERNTFASGKDHRLEVGGEQFDQGRLRKYLPRNAEEVGLWARSGKRSGVEIPHAVEHGELRTGYSPSDLPLIRLSNAHEAERANISYTEVLREDVAYALKMAKPSIERNPDFEAVVKFLAGEVNRIPPEELPFPSARLGEWPHSAGISEDAWRTVVDSLGSLRGRETGLRMDLLEAALREHAPDLVSALSVGDARDLRNALRDLCVDNRIRVKVWDDPQRDLALDVREAFKRLNTRLDHLLNPDQAEATGKAIGDAVRDRYRSIQHAARDEAIRTLWELLGKEEANHPVGKTLEQVGDEIGRLLSRPQQARAELPQILYERFNIDIPAARELADALIQRRPAFEFPGHSGSRGVDAEAKLIAQIRDTLYTMAPTEAERQALTGTILIAPDKEMCPSCQQLASHLQSEFSGIRVLVGGEGREYSPRVADTPGFTPGMEAVRQADLFPTEHPVGAADQAQHSDLAAVPSQDPEATAIRRRNPILDALTGHAEQQRLPEGTVAGHDGIPHFGTESHDSRAHLTGGSSAGREWPPDFRELTIPGRPEWDGKIHVKEDWVIIGNDPELATGMGQPIAKGTLLLKVHGQRGEIYPDTNARQPIEVTDPAFRQVLEAAGWREGQPIILAACEAASGDNPVDLRLMQALHSEVIATDETVWQDHRGNLLASPVDRNIADGRPRPEIPPSGSWFLRHLDGSREVLPPGDERRPPTPENLDREGSYHPLKLHGSDESDFNRALYSDPPSTTPLDVARAMVNRSVNEIRQIFPKQAIYQNGDKVTIITYEEITSDQKNLLGDTIGTGKSSRVVGEEHVRVLIEDRPVQTVVAKPEIVMDQKTGQYCVVIHQGSSPDEVTRLLAHAIGDLYAQHHPGSPDGAFKELDALSMHWNRAEALAAQARAEGDGVAAGAWADEAGRLREQFRVRAEEVGILPHEGDPPNDARARRDEAWPGMSDNTRRLASRMAGDPMPTFLPGAGYFKEEYNRLDSLAYYLETFAPPNNREEFFKQVLPEVTSQDFPGEFKKTYKEFLPSISNEGPLTPERAADALGKTTEIGRKVEDAYTRMVEWAKQRGIFERNGVTVDQAVASGAEEFHRAYERTTARIQKIVAEVCDQYKISLDYVGSMRSGSRGPHKGGVHANLDDFDLDLFIVDRDWYDMEYLRAMTFFPDQASRGKILSDDRSVSQPDLNELNDVLVAKLAQEFRINPSVAESRIALRREPPPPRPSSAP